MRRHQTRRVLHQACASSWTRETSAACRPRAHMSIDWVAGMNVRTCMQVDFFTAKTTVASRVFDYGEAGSGTGGCLSATLV